MGNVEPRVMQELLDEIENLERELKGMVTTANGKLNTTRIRCESMLGAGLRKARGAVESPNRGS